MRVHADTHTHTRARLSRAKELYSLCAYRSRFTLMPAVLCCCVMQCVCSHRVRMQRSIFRAASLGIRSAAAKARLLYAAAAVAAIVIACGPMIGRHFSRCAAGWRVPVGGFIFGLWFSLGSLGKYWERGRLNYFRIQWREENLYSIVLLPCGIIECSFDFI